jgi:hypothetical protein
VDEMAHLIRDDISMPRNHIERTVILLNGVIQSIRLVYNGPIPMQFIINTRHWMQEIARICQTMSTQRAQVW